MKKIAHICIAIAFIFSSVFADVQFWDFRENAKRPGEYYPISYNQYGIDTGVLQFPDDVQILYHEKAKQVFPNPEMVPSGELLNKDYQERNDYYEHQYQTTGSTDIPFPGKEYDMMGRGEIPIPKTSESIEYFIASVGGKKNFLSLLSGWQKRANHLDQIEDIPAVQIIGSEYRCTKPRIYSLQDYSPFSNHSIYGDAYQSCQFEDGQKLFYNTYTTRRWIVHSEIDQKVTATLFPVDPAKNKFIRGMYWDSSTVVSLIDPALEYKIEEISRSNSDAWERGTATKKQLAQKYTFHNYWEDGEEYHTMVIFPYYEITLNLKKGDNTITLEYHSYTPTDGTSFFIVE